MDFKDRFWALIEADAQELREDVAAVPPGVVPEDAGHLRRAIETDLELSPETLSWRLRVRSTTPPNSDFPYPRFINDTPVIAPTRAEALRFVTGGGEVVFSKAFQNPNYRWWENDFVPWLVSRAERIRPG